METNKVGIRSFKRPGGVSSYFQTDKMPNSLDPSASVPRTRASSATPSAPPTSESVRKPSLPAELTTDLLARQEIFNRISTSSVIYGSKPEIPAKPSFARYSSMRNSRDMTDTQEVDAREEARESLEESVSFSELDETDSVVETQSVKDSIIEENEEEETEEVNQWQAPPSAPNFRLGRLGDKDERLKTANDDVATRQQATNVSHNTNKLETETRALPPDTAKILAAVETKHHTEPRVPKGIVGFASLPDQVYRRSLRKGFEFCLMVVGESGLGKSTLVNSMFMTDIYSSKETEVSPSLAKTVQVETHSVVLQEGGVKLSLNVVDTPGFGDGVDNTGCWEPITEYVDEQFNSFLEAESRVNRVAIPDNRVHVCLYFLAPTGHGLRAVDVEFMKRLHFKVNIIPVIGKSDTCTREELAAFKVRIRAQLTEHQICVYNFPGAEEGAEETMVPFAVVGSNTVLKDDHGKKVRGRRYPWGTVNIEDKNHCDFVSLRHLVLAKHMQDLKDVTSQCHYEKYRCEKLTSMALNKEGTTLLKNPLALIEDEKLAHNDKLRKMKGDMEEVFNKKVEEKEGRLRRYEQDEEARLGRERRGVEEERASIISRREDLEREKKTWATNNGIEMSKFLGRSTESLDSKRKKYTLPNNPFRFGRS